MIQSLKNNPVSVVVASYALAYSIAAVVVCAGIVVIGAGKIVERFT